MIDMIVAKSTIAYHLYLSLYTTNRYITTLPISVGSGLYFASMIFEKKKYIKNGGHYALFTSYTCLDRGVVYISRLFLAEHVYMNVVYKVGLQSSV
jgi:hypothetical protein